TAGIILNLQVLQVDLSTTSVIHIVADGCLITLNKISGNMMTKAKSSGLRAVAYLSARMIFGRKTVSTSGFLHIRKKLIYAGGLKIPEKKYFTLRNLPFITWVAAR